MIKEEFKVEIQHLNGDSSTQFFSSHADASDIYHDALKSQGIKARLFRNDELLTEFGY
jgi:hypothetical protein